jgi:hypothetical protein
LRMASEVHDVRFSEFDNGPVSRYNYQFINIPEDAS